MKITYAIIGITSVISFLAFNNPALMSKMIMNPFKIDRNREYYRFITSGFIHANFTHLLFNMFSFYFFAGAVEKTFYDRFGVLGNVYFVALYLLAILVSDFPTFFKERNHPQYNSLGASGAVSAVIFAFILFNPLQDICPFIQICLPGFIMGILFIVASYYQGRKSNDSINHEAHLYGALFGLVFCVIVYPVSFLHFFEQIRNWSFLDRF